MCACDESIGEGFLQHQLAKGTVLETQQRIPVTGGFQPGICNECRGLPLEVHPVASIPGRTSKIRRYYWRELAFRKMQLFAERASAQGLSPESVTVSKATQIQKEVAEQALREIKHLHETSPKYMFREEPQSEIIQKYNVAVLNLKGVYDKSKYSLKARIFDSGTCCLPKNSSVAISNEMVINRYSLRVRRFMFFSVFICGLLSRILPIHICAL